MQPVPISKIASKQKVFAVVSALLVTLGLSLFFTQACGQFNSAEDIGGDTSSSVAPFSIVSNHLSGTGQTLSFAYQGATLPSNAIVNWSSIMSDANGAPLTACTELNGESTSTYQLSCAEAGILTVALNISGTGADDGDAELLVGIGGVATTPTTTTGGPNAAGATLFATDCASCHGGSLSNNNIGGVLPSAITDAIANQPAMMGVSTLTNLTATQIQQISDALNGK